MGWSGITYQRALTTLEQRLLDVLTDRGQALDHNLLWLGYAPAYTPEAVSKAIQTLKRRGFIQSERRGWYVATATSRDAVAFTANLTQPEGS
jgi:hypothetical protein